MNLLLVLPLLIPLATAAFCLTFWRQVRLQRWLSVLGNAALLGAALALFSSVRHNGIQATEVGNWPAPFGIIFISDLLSAIMIVLAAITGLVVAVYSLAGIDCKREAFGFHPLLNVLLMGVCGAFLTGDAFDLFVWFEVMLIASFVLLALGSERAQLEAAIKYVTINLVSSTIFLTALGILYGIAGTLNMADLAVKLAGTDEPGLITTVAMMFLISFGIKAGLFPLFFWLPASYHTPPPIVSAVFAGLMTKVGVYALIRFFSLIFVQDINYTHSLILVFACLTMIAGSMGAIIQNDVRRALSFNIISQIGLVLVGLALLSPLALSGMIFLVIEDVIVLTCLFLVTGVLYRLCGSYHLAGMGGFYRTSPGLSLLFLIPALSIAGIPPLPGFFAKLALIRALLEREQYLATAIVLGVSMLTLFNVTRLWSEIFWKERPEMQANTLETDARAEPAKLPAPMTRREKLLLAGPIVVLVVLTVGMGIGAEPIFSLAASASQQLLDPSAYIQAVLKPVEVGIEGVQP